MTSVLPYFLLGLALFVALGFEFVNGFHDTANAVATVIYTHTLDPHIACFSPIKAPFSLASALPGSLAETMGRKESAGSHEQG
jgi:phosphate/sulfate permease